MAAGRRAEALRLFMVELVGIPPELATDATRLPQLQAIAHTLPYDAAVLADHTVPARPEVPTLVLTGGLSPRWMHDAAHAVAGEHQTLPDQTHDVDPAVLARALTEFFT